jgi:hypothetical protein
MNNRELIFTDFSPLTTPWQEECALTVPVRVDVADYRRKS